VCVCVWEGGGEATRGKGERHVKVVWRFDAFVWHMCMVKGSQEGRAQRKCWAVSCVGMQVCRRVLACTGSAHGHNLTGQQHMTCPHTPTL
jgi:hypothetical protein